MATTAVHPGVLWAQRQKLVFVTIEVSDIEKPDIKVSPLLRRYSSTRFRV
jgi:hypothetical protein